MTDLRNLLEIPYDELENLNIEAKNKQLKRVARQELKDHYINYLKQENRIKAVTICFSDLEGRFHMLDYDKKFLVLCLQIEPNKQVDDKAFT